MSRWWRAYNDAIDHPKLLGLSNRQHRGWFNLMCIAAANDGIIRDPDLAAKQMRLKPQKLSNLVSDLISKRLFERMPDGSIKPHNWGIRQYKSDTSTERVKRFRQRSRNGHNNVPETDTEIQRRKKEEDSSSSLRSEEQSSAKYAFGGSVVRLTAKDLAQWKQAYSHLDLMAELVARDAWLANDASDADRKRWFVSTSKYLANRNMEAKSKADSKQPWVWKSGIEGVI